MTEGNGEVRELPNGWVWTKLGTLCTDPQYGYTTKAANAGRIKLLRTTDITSGRINWRTVPFCSEEPTNSEKYQLHEGDIVISRAGSVGFSYLINKPEFAVFASYLIRFKPLINRQFFKFFLDNPSYWSNISEKKLGIAVPNVNASKLKDIGFPLPPLVEQNRIVDKIEELFSELDQGIKSLKTAQKQLKVYRQVVLKWAFEGKLTEKWRLHIQQEKLDIKTGEELLAQIKAERENRYQQQLTEWGEAVREWEAISKVGKKPAKPQKI